MTSPSSLRSGHDAAIFWIIFNALIPYSESLRLLISSSENHLLGCETEFGGGRWRVEDVDDQARNEDDDSRITGGLVTAIEDLIVQASVIGLSCWCVKDCC